MPLSGEKKREMLSVFADTPHGEDLMRLLQEIDHLTARIHELEPASDILDPKLHERLCAEAMVQGADAFTERERRLVVGLYAMATQTFTTGPCWCTDQGCEGLCRQSPRCQQAKAALANYPEPEMRDDVVGHLVRAAAWWDATIGMADGELYANALYNLREAVRAYRRRYAAE